MLRLTESTGESAAPAWLAAGGWRIAHGLDITPHKPATEALEEAFCTLTRPPGSNRG